MKVPSLNRRLLLCGALTLFATSAFGHVERHIDKPSRRGLTISHHDRDILARTLWGEARGEPELGQIAVAHAVFNRVERPDLLFAHDTSVSVACQRHDQFECWQKERRRLLSLNRDLPIYTDMLNTASIAVIRYKDGEDVVNGATHFFRVGTRRPAWAHHFTFVRQIGHHAFFRPALKLPLDS